MAESTEAPTETNTPILNRQVSRRSFLRGAVLAVAAAVVAGVAVGRSGQPGQSKDEKKPTHEILPDITEEEVKGIAKRTVADFNRVLGLNISEEQVIKGIHLVNTEGEYRQILSNIGDEDFVDQAIKHSSAVTTPTGSTYGKSIFIYKKAVDKISEEQKLPNNEYGLKGRVNNLEWLVAHELAHWSAAAYPSKEIYDTFFGEIVRNAPEFKGKVIEPRDPQRKEVLIEGIGLRALVDGKKTTIFHPLEEAEAFIIGENVFKNKSIPVVGGPFPKHFDQDFFVQANYLLLLLDKLGNRNHDENLKRLAKLRTQIGGQEEFCRIIGQNFDVLPEDQLSFGLRFLYLINYRNVPALNKLFERLK